MLPFLGKATDPHILFYKAIFNILCAILFGTRFKHEDEFLQLNIHYITEISNHANTHWSMVSAPNSGAVNSRLLSLMGDNLFEIFKENEKWGERVAGTNWIAIFVFFFLKIGRFFRDKDKIFQLLRAGPDNVGALSKILDCPPPICAHPFPHFMPIWLPIWP